MEFKRGHATPLCSKHTEKGARAPPGQPVSFHPTSILVFDTTRSSVLSELMATGARTRSSPSCAALKPGRCARGAPRTGASSRDATNTVRDSLLDARLRDARCARARKQHKRELEARIGLLENSPLAKRHDLR